MRVPGTFAERLYSYESVCSRPYRETDPSKTAHVLRVLRQPPVKRLRAYLRTMTYVSGRTQEYPRDVLFAFFVTALALGLTLRDAREFVLGSRELCAFLGLPLPTPERLARLNTPRRRPRRALRKKHETLLLRNDETLDEAATVNRDGSDDACIDLNEPNFPTRQEINDFVSWLDSWTEKQNDTFMKMLHETTYVIVPLEVLRDNPKLKLCRVAFDTKVCASPNRYEERVRADDGAHNLPNNFGRRKATVVGEVALALASVVSQDERGESTLVAEELIPQFFENRERMRDRARELGYDPARILPIVTMVADSQMNTDAVHKAIYDGDGRPLIRTDNMLNREIVGLREVTVHGRSVLLEQANDGTLFCPCSSHMSMRERLPMTQALHRHGRNGAVCVRCEKGSACAHTKGARIFVPFGGPTHRQDGSRIPPDERSRWVGVGPHWMADARAPATIHKLENTIEHYHKLQVERTLMGHKDHGDRRRRVWGTFANTFWWTLADLIHNLNIQFGLRAVRSLRYLDWRDQFFATAANWLQIRRSKNGEKGKTPRGRRRRRRPTDPLHSPYVLHGSWILATPVT